MSDITETKLIGKRHSFYQLLEENNYSIEIPIIQRDYAQGRKSKSEVRDLFLQALYDYLDENIPNRDLDFVYGTTEVRDKSEKFIPLDGQQRLTTLFLLHWYLANLSSNMQVFKNVIFKNEKSDFTYLTRTSSSEFCDAILHNEIDLTNLLDPDKGEKNSLSKTIKDKGWYYLSWGNDPTIQSMLTMLDAIHSKFANKPEFFERLTNKENPIITFLYLDLGDFKLTEDLYIKMNSRGKPLTTFENFKAKFEQHISNLFSETDKPFTLLFDGNEMNVSVKEYFSFNIDTKWANLFWQYRKLAGKENTFDEELMNFIRVIVSNQFAIENPINIGDYKFLTRSETGLSEDAEFISFNKLKNINALSKNCILYLIDAFDNLTNGENKIKIHLTDFFYFNETDIFEKALTHKLTYPERVLFHAYVKFLIVNKDDKSNIYQWMRIVQNLTEHTRFDEADQAVSAINAIEKLIPNSKNILEYLIQPSSKIDFFVGRQVQEEKLKAHLITKSNKWKESIEKYEKEIFYKGQIGFIFDFSGILNYYENNNHCQWTAAEDEVFYKTFLNYANKATITFSIAERTDDFLLERAVLSKGNYLIPASSNRLNFAYPSAVKNYQRDFSWKRVLRLPPIGQKDEEILWAEKRSFVKQVFDDTLFKEDNIEKSLKDILKITPEDWRKYFVLNPELIEYCLQGFIYFKTEDDIQLFNASQMNHRHREMYSYNFYLKHMSEQSNYLPFTNFDHIEVKGDYDYSFALLNEWCYKRIYFSIEIYKNNSDNKFEIIFSKEKGSQKIEEYPKEIITILENAKFKWNDEMEFFTIFKNDESKTFTFLKNFCLELNNL